MARWGKVCSREHWAKPVGGNRMGGGKGRTDYRVKVFMTHLGLHCKREMTPGPHHPIWQPPAT